MADTTATTQPTDWAGALTSGMNIAQGLYNLFGGNQEAVKAGMAAADPFATQRPMYQGMLASLMTNPSSFQLSPAAQAATTQGMTDLGRAGAAKGYLGSGNLLSELTKFGTQTAMQDYYQQAGLLSQLAGAGVGSPGTAAQLAASKPASTGSALSTIGSGIGGLSQAVGGLGNLATTLGQAGSSIADWWSGLGSTTAPITDYTASLGSASDAFFGSSSSGALDSSLSSLTADLGSGTNYVGDMSSLFGSWF